MPEYTGEDRREHCKTHDEQVKAINDNTVEVSKMTASAATLKWILGGAGVLALTAVGYLMTTLTTISNDVKETNKTVQSSAIAIAQVQANQLYISQRVERLEEKK